MELNWPRMPRHKRRQLMDEARALVKFPCAIYKMQHKAGRIFIHEHPQSAASWKEDSLKAVMDLPGVHKIDLDMCCYGLTTETPQGELPARKPTSLLVNSSVMAKCLAKRCSGSHKHGQLKGGSKCAKAAVYTPQFCKAIVQAYQQHWHKYLLSFRRKTISRNGLAEIAAENALGAVMCKSDQC